MFKAKDIMTTHIVSVRPTDTIDHVIFLMVKHLATRPLGETP